MSDNKKSVGCSISCLGCLSVIFFGIVMWALLFGVTVGGQHYGLGFSCDRGVVVE
jgi:hypothetical protein